MPTLVTVLALALTAVATYTDVRWHKIYNWTTYPGIVAGLTFSAAGWLAVRCGADADGLTRWGWIYPWESAVGLLACGTIMLVCYVVFGAAGVGGGDVKLIAMIGALLGGGEGLEAMLWTFVLGACVGLIVLIWRVGPWRLLTRVLRQMVYMLRIGGWSPLTPDERAQLQPPLFLAPCALAALVIVGFGLERYIP